MTGAESEPAPSIEAQVLTRLGYGQYLDVPIKEGSQVVGRNFLDAYGDSPHRQDTEDLLYGFLDMPETDSDYADTKAYINRFIEAYFGPLQGS